MKEKNPAAVILGRKGGSAGRGASKRRGPEHYRKMVEARKKKNDELLLSTRSAYDYIVNTICAQGGLLDIDTLYTGYKSMHFKNPLSEKMFKTVYSEIKKYITQEV